MNELKFNDYMISFLPGLCYEVLCEEDNILEYFDVKKHQEKIQSFEHISNLDFAKEFNEEVLKPEIKTDFESTRVDIIVDNQEEVRVPKYFFKLHLQISPIDLDLMYLQSCA